MPRSPITTPSFPRRPRPRRLALSADERRIYDLVCRRLLSAWHDDHIWSVTTVITAIRNRRCRRPLSHLGHRGAAGGLEGARHRGRARSRRRARPAGDEAKAEQVLPPGLAEGEPQEVVDVEAIQKKTRPPKRFTEATLLTAMETAGKTLDEKELSDAMKETRPRHAGDARRHHRGAAQARLHRAQRQESRSHRQGHPADRGRAPRGEEPGHDRPVGGVPHAHPAGQSAARAVSERHRGLCARGGGQGRHVQSRRTKAAVAASTAHIGRAASAEPACPPRAVARARRTRSPTLLHRAFGFSSFRPNQEAVCQAAVDGKDVLLVMPTGSGKSLCYQLPGIARGGTTLVISPLIALMEDQVAKLKERGFAVERIHSGRERAASRQACIDYLDGNCSSCSSRPSGCAWPASPRCWRSASRR